MLDVRGGGRGYSSSPSPGTTLLALEAVRSRKGGDPVTCPAPLGEPGGQGSWEPAESGQPPSLMPPIARYR